MNRVDVIVKMRERGSTFEHIGRLLGLTKQRVQQIYAKMRPPVESSECEVCGHEGTKKSGYTLCASCEAECIRLKS